MFWGHCPIEEEDRLARDSNAGSPGRGSRRDRLAIDAAAGRVYATLRRQFENKTIAGAASTFTIRVLAAGLAFGLQVILARHLHAMEYGKYVMAFTWLIVIGHVAAFGFSESCIRFLPRYAQRNQGNYVAGFLKTGFLVAITGSAAAGFVAVVALCLLRNTISPTYLPLLLVFAIGLPIVSLEAYLEGIARSFGWFRLTLVPAYVLRPSLIALLVLLVYHAEQNLTAPLALAGFVSATAGLTLFQLFVIRIRVRRKFGVVSSTRPRKLWVKASLPLALFTGIEELFHWSDILVLGFMVPPDEVSVYFAAQRSMALAAFVQFAFMLVTAPQFSRAKAKGDKAELQRSVTIASRWTFWLTLPAVTVTLAVGYPLLRLFGSEFVSGYPTMAVLGAAFVFRASTGQAQDLLIVLGHQKIGLTLLVSSVLLNVVLAILLVPGLGGLGAAVALALTCVVRAVAIVIAARKVAGLWVLTDMPGFSLRKAARRMAQS